MTQYQRKKRNIAVRLFDGTAACALYLVRWLRGGGHRGTYYIDENVIITDGGRRIAPDDSVVEEDGKLEIHDENSFHDNFDLFR